MDNSYPISVHLTVADVKKSIKFFTEKLGFTVHNTFPDLKKPVWASLVLDKQSVMLGACLSVEDAKKFEMSKEEIDMVKKDGKAFTKSPHGIGAITYICVADVDSHYKSAKKKKVGILAPPKTQFYGLREYLAQDLDGYRFIFYTRVQADQTDGRPTSTTTPEEKHEEAVAE